MLRHPVEHAHAVKLVRSRLAGFDTPGQLLPGANVPIVGQHHRHVADARVGVRSQRFGKRSLRETPVLQFREDADARVRPQKTIQRLLLRSGKRGQFLGTLRTGFQMIGDAEMCGRGNRARYPFPHNHLQQCRVRRRRWNWLSHKSIIRTLRLKQMQSGNHAAKVPVPQNPSYDPGRDVSGFAPRAPESCPDTRRAGTPTRS